MSTLQHENTETRSSFARIPAAFRLQFVLPTPLIWIPLLILVSAWIITIIIAAWIRNLADGPLEPTYTGAFQAPLWGLLFVAASSAASTFSFSMALSYSRRVFVIGAFLAFGLVSLVYGLIFALGALLERATNGFGFETYVYDLPYLTQGPGGVVSAGAAAAVLCLFLMMFGFFWAILYRRVTLAGLWAVILGAVVALLGTVMLITQYGSWRAFGQWFVEQNALTLGGWLLIPLVGITLLNYAIIRKATPA